MSLIANGAGEQPTGFYNGVVETSTRFEDGDDAYLHFTPGSAGNTKTWTISMWFKLGNPERGNLWTIGVNQSGIAGGMSLTAANLLEVNAYAGGTNNFFTTSRKFRDVSSWYHVVWHVDTTQGTQADRMNLYINGVKETSFANESYPAQDSVTKLNTAIAHWIGRYPESNYEFPYDGYIAEVNFIDGLALTPTSFGETKNGIWIAKDTSGLTFGNQGYRLQMKQSGVGTAGTSTVGADTSGNTNHWTSVNLVASDCAMPDSPENNFATWNPLRKSESASTFSEGNLKAVIPVSSANSICATMGVSSGKYYWEVQRVAERPTLGVGDSTDVASVSGFPTGGNEFGYFAGSGNKYPGDSSYGATYANGDIIGFALDMDAGTLVAYKNNASQGTLATGLTDTIFPFVYNGTASLTVIGNFGQDSSFAGTKTAQGNTDGNGIGDFYYDPGDYLALCTSNLPKLTIGPNSGANNQSDDHFNTILYTGNATGSTGITGVGFKPDWLWIKNRATTNSHALFDSARGSGSNGFLRHATNLTTEEQDPTNVASLDADGFTLGDNAGTNGNGNALVAWNWKANGGTATATISESGNNPAAVVQANPTAGFSLITYTGTGADGTIAHGLGAKPAWYFVKNRDVNSHNWLVWHQELATNGAMSLNLTAAAISASARFTSNEPTTSVFYVGSDGSTNADGEKFIAHVFAEVEGYSRFGSYTGNSNVDGTFVYTGFRPAWVMIKWTAGASDWRIWDSTRDTYNPATAELLANSNVDEETPLALDVLSNGFKPRVSDSEYNLNNNTYVYMAFAEAPFKYANAR